MGTNYPAAVDTYRIGEAARLLGVRVETLRRWEHDGKLTVERTSGGQRVVAAAEVAGCSRSVRRRGRSPPGARATGSPA